MTDGPEVLIIDDDPNLRKTLSDILRASGYAPYAAGNGAEGLAFFKEKPVNLVLIDLKLPDMSGIEVLNCVKTDSPATQAIILTGSATLDSAIEATNKGAFSYLEKPYEIDQLLLNIRRAVEKQRAEERIVRQNIELERINVELKALYEETKSVALHDPLTGLANRRFMQMQLEKGCEAVRRYGSLLSVIMLDIDHFKRYNDTRGHTEGDKLLARLAQVLLKAVRNADHVFRYGGEEFLIMLPETDLKGACNVAERLRQTVESAGEVTVSLGVAIAGGTIEKEDDLVAAADKALYKAKLKGRNRVEEGLSEAA